MYSYHISFSTGLHFHEQYSYDTNQGHRCILLFKTLTNIRGINLIHTVVMTIIIKDKKDTLNNNYGCLLCIILYFFSIRRSIIHHTSKTDF
jgi:hypothetical protein